MMPLPISPSELIMLLFLWLPGQPTGQPASAQEVFRYVPAQADFTVTVDAGSWTASAMRGFTDLGQRSFLRRSPELSRRYKAADRMLQRGLGMLKLMGQFDPVRDVRWVTVSGRVSGGAPQVAVAVGGSLKPSLIERIAAAKGISERRLPNGRLFASKRGGESSLGWTRDDVLLIGDRAMLETLLRRKPRPTKLARLAMARHDGRSFLSAAVLPRASRELKALRRQLPSPLRPLLDGVAGVAMSLRYDGLRLAVMGRNGRLLGRYQRVLDGLGDYLAAAELVARGSLKIGDGLISPKDARHYPRALRALVKQKGEVLRYLRQLIALASSPSHGVAIDARHRLATLTYRGSRYAGLVPLIAGIGGLEEMHDTMRRRHAPPPPPLRAPRKRAGTHR